MEKALIGLGLGIVDFKKRLGEDKDILILQKINDGIQGTLELSREVDLAPKNFINRIKKLTNLKLIEVKNIPAKPKGRIRVYSLTQLGSKTIEEQKELNKILKELEPKIRKDWEKTWEQIKAKKEADK